MTGRYRIFLWLAALFLGGASLKADEACLALIRAYEETYGIPKNLLVAMAKVESGRYDKVSKIFKISPWVVQLKGKGYFFNTQQEAQTYVKKRRQEGITNIDIGCLQVNLHHHGKAFKDLAHAFTPEVNIEFAARYLKELRQKRGSWAKAIGYYHSANLVYNHPYRLKVYKMWAKTRQEEYNLSAQLRKRGSSPLFKQKQPERWVTAHGHLQTKRRYP